MLSSLQWGSQWGNRERLSPFLQNSSIWGVWQVHNHEYGNVYCGHVSCHLICDYSWLAPPYAVYASLIFNTLNILRHHISTHWDCYLAKFFILWVVAHVLPLQEHVDFPERGPLALLPVPALPHQVVDLLGAVRGLRQVHLQVVVAVVVSGILDDLLVGQHVVWLVLVEGQHLPQGDGKWPHVALCCKLALLKRKLSVKFG